MVIGNLFDLALFARSIASNFDNEIADYFDSQIGIAIPTNPGTSSRLTGEFVMAAFPQHMQFSTVLGVGYTAALHWGFGYELPHSIVAGGLCSLCGMLPDLDSDSGRPLREMIPLLAAIGGIVCFHRLGSQDPDMRLLLAAGTYFLIRYGVSFVIKRWSEHRGMFHSFPALLIPTLLVYLAWVRRTHGEGLVVAGGVALGYFSHLLLDEIYAIDFHGLAIKPNQFSGTAFKFFHPKSWVANIFCWSICLFLASRVAVEEGYLNEYLPTIQQMRQMKKDVLSWAGVTQEQQNQGTVHTVKKP